MACHLFYACQEFPDEFFVGRGEAVVVSVSEVEAKSVGG